MPEMKTAPAASARRTPKTLVGELPPTMDEHRKEILGLYESALRLMQEGKFEKAHVAFDKMLASCPTDLADRVRMYIAACLQQVSRGKTTFSSGGTPPSRKNDKSQPGWVKNCSA